MTSRKTGTTRVLTWLLTIPILLLAAGLLVMVWAMDISLLAKAGYTAGVVLAAYWLYTPKSPRQIIIKNILSLIILWGIVASFVFTWALINFNPAVFQGMTKSEAARGSWIMAVWTLVFTAAAVGASWRIYRSLQKNLQISALFSRYVAPAVIMEMMKSRENFFKTEKTELTVLFVDLRGFTSTSSKLSAEQVKELINTFMGVMIPVAHQWRGTVDKTVGDEIMILFGAPLRYDDHADQAVKTALELKRRHQEVSTRWKSKGLPVLEMGMGINTGEMVVGNIGCPERVDYTVLGHHVNLAARICAQARGSEILLSEFTRGRLADDLKRLAPEADHREIEAKGLIDRVKVYPLREPSES
ncbi:MAG: adenylate/guanylate cyclase domain-containing protein [Thermodesulfobacteriota bacterium]